MRNDGSIRRGRHESTDRLPPDRTHTLCSVTPCQREAFEGPCSADSERRIGKSWSGEPRNVSVAALVHQDPAQCWCCCTPALAFPNVYQVHATHATLRVSHSANLNLPGQAKVTLLTFPAARIVLHSWHCAKRASRTPERRRSSPVWAVVTQRAHLYQGGTWQRRKWEIAHKPADLVDKLPVFVIRQPDSHRRRMHSRKDAMTTAGTSQAIFKEAAAAPHLRRPRLLMNSPPGTPAR